MIDRVQSNRCFTFWFCFGPNRFSKQNEACHHVLRFVFKTCENKIEMWRYFQNKKKHKTNMKITKQELHQIITEELTNALVSLREVSTKVNWEQIAKTYEAHLSKQSDVKNPKKVVYDNIKIAKDDPSGEEAGLNKLASQLKSTYGFDIVQQ